MRRASFRRPWRGGIGGATDVAHRMLLGWMVWTSTLVGTVASRADDAIEARHASPSAPGAPVASLACRTALLRELGWRIDEIAGGASDPTAALDERSTAANAASSVETDDTLRIDAGTPCERASLADAQAHGDLRVVAPRGGLTHATADVLFANPATRCAFAFRLGDATRHAIDRLAANDGYRFSGLQLGWVGFGRGGARADGWRPLLSFRRALQPVASPADAIASFYTGTVRSECGVGRQIAQYATQRELYGAAAFDAEFAPDEIVIGSFIRLHETRSILLGSGAGEFARDGLGVAASALGRQAFVGTPGFFVHRYDRAFIDDLNNQAQNFVVYDVDDAAARALRLHGGFAYYNDRDEAIWREARAMKLTGHAAFERLLIDRDRNLRGRLDDAQRAHLATIEALLDDPFYRGFRIYVHDHAVRDIRFHLARMLDRNPRTPYQTEFALSNVRTTLMQRWFAHRLRDCAAADRRE